MRAAGLRERGADGFLDRLALGPALRPEAGQCEPQLTELGKLGAALQQRKGQTRLDAPLRVIRVRVLLLVALLGRQVVRTRTETEGRHPEGSTACGDLAILGLDRGVDGHQHR
jgi:hypothetical protein